MARLVDADALLKDITDYPYGYRGMIKDTIARQPTVDAVKVVRCKDCKNYGTDENRLNCNVFCCSMPKEGFCSMGERRKDETD